MMRGGSRQSGRPVFGDPVPAQRTVPDAAASSPVRIRPPNRRRHDRPDASLALRRGIAGGPQRGPPATAIPALESASPQTPFNPGTAGEGLECARAWRCFTPNGTRPAIEHDLTAKYIETVQYGLKDDQANDLTEDDQMVHVLLSGPAYGGYGAVVVSEES